MDERNEMVWKDDNGKELSCFKMLIQKILAIPASSADAERGFSAQNSIKTKQRSRLTLKSLDAIMRVKLNGIEDALDFDALGKLWIRSKRVAVGSRNSR